MVRPARRGSGRSDLTRTRSAAGSSPGIGFRGGASPELGDLSASGIKTTRAWVKEDQRDMGKPPRAKARLGKAQGERIDGGVDLHDGASPAHAFRSKRGLKVYDI
jgi:hypothetical protein